MSNNPISQTPPNLVILGIDPGTRILGYSIINVFDKTPTIGAMGVVDLHKCQDTYLKLGRIYQNICRLIDTFKPDELAIESPFYGKNIQTTLQLGRAPGVAMAAAISRDMTVHEYPPTKIKLAVTSNGMASKQQVAGMLQKIFKINPDNMLPYFDATDALAVAYCHYTQRKTIVSAKEYSTWSAFAKNNTSRIIPTRKKK